MRTLEEIRKRIKWCRLLTGSTYHAEIETKRWRGSVVFGFDEDGWEHVSVSPYNGKLPAWDDMCEIKDIFWDDEEEVIQIHPKKSEYVNMVDNCLHLWRRKTIESKDVRLKEFRKWLEGIFQDYMDMYREALEDDVGGLCLRYLGKVNMISEIIRKFEEVFCDE